MRTRARMPFLNGALRRAVPGIPQLGKLLSAQGLPFGLIAVVNVVMVLVLSPAERGRAAAVVTAGTLIASVGFLNLQLGVVAGYRRGEVSSPARGLCIMGLISALLVLMSSAALTSPSAVAALGLGQPIDVVICLTGASLALVSLYAARVLQGLGRAGAYLYTTAGQAVAYAVCIFGLAATKELTGRTAALSWAVAGGVAALIGVALLTPLLRTGGRPWVRGASVIRQSLSGHLAACAYQLLYRADLLLLASFATSGDVGQYALAVAAAEVVWRVAEALALSVYAQGPAEPGAPNHGKRLEQHLRAYRKIAAPLSALSVLGLGGSVAFFVPDYQESVCLLLILLPGVVAGGELRIRLGALNADSTASHRVRVLAGLAAVSCLAYVPAIAWWHAAGAAGASTAVYTLNALAARRLTGAPRADARLVTS